MKLRGIIILLVLLSVLVYVILNNTREHLTPGPPTLLTLQTDTQDLDSRLTDLKTQFDKMVSKIEHLNVWPEKNCNDGDL